MSEVMPASYKIKRKRGDNRLVAVSVYYTFRAYHPRMPRMAPSGSESPDPLGATVSELSKSGAEDELSPTFVTISIKTDF